MQALNLHIPQYICRVTFLFCFFKTRSGWPRTQGPSASASWVLGLLSTPNPAHRVILCVFVCVLIV
jgi:hypothetical protein